MTQQQQKTMRAYLLYSKKASKQDRRRRSGRKCSTPAKHHGNNSDSTLTSVNKAEWGVQTSHLAQLYQAILFFLQWGAVRGWESRISVTTQPWGVALPLSVRGAVVGRWQFHQVHGNEAPLALSRGISKSRLEHLDTHHYLTVTGQLSLSSSRQGFRGDPNKTEDLSDIQNGIIWYINCHNSEITMIIAKITHLPRSTRISSWVRKDKH